MASDSLQPKNAFVYLIILGIAGIFILQFGPASGACDAPLSKSQADVAATVNGDDIPSREFKANYAQYLEARHIPKEMAQRFGFPKQVLDELISAKLLEQAAERKGIQASDEDLRTLLLKAPVFQVDDHFDVSAYNNYVTRALNQSVPDFETGLRKKMSAARLLAAIEASAFLSDDELRAGYFKNGDKANLTLVRFVPSMFADKVGKPTPAQIAAYGKAHVADVDAYYASNKSTFHQAERVHARHILVKMDRTPTPAAKDAAKKKAEALREEIKGGKDFADVAKRASEDPGSKALGGDLGTMDRASSGWVPAFANAAFSQKVGEISAPIETPFGFHLIQVLEKKPTEDRALEQVRGEIATTLYKRDEAKKLARAAAEKTLAALKKGKSLHQQFPSTKDEGPESQFSVLSKPEAQETGEFSVAGETIPNVGLAPELARDVASAKDGAKILDRVYNPSDSFVVAQVASRKHPTDEDFTAQKDKIRKEAESTRRSEVADSYQKALRKTGQVRVNDQVLVGTEQS